MVQMYGIFRGDVGNSQLKSLYWFCSQVYLYSNLKFDRRQFGFSLTYQRISSVENFLSHRIVKNFSLLSAISYTHIDQSEWARTYIKVAYANMLRTPVERELMTKIKLALDPARVKNSGVTVQADER